MIYSISDLHLDYTKKKTMELFGSSWSNYEERIFLNWENIIQNEDLVLVPGDITWAMNEKEAAVDLNRIDRLPGKKILLKGNHDYWWNSLKKLNELNLSTISFLQNNSFEHSGYSIAGTRGWIDKSHKDFIDKDVKIFERELLRLELSLQSTKGGKIICMLHYPPFSEERIPNEFGKIMEKYNVQKCIYGHLHGDGLQNVQEGTYNGIEYVCTSSDYLEFYPIKVGE
ncbi:metallophosphoesterase [Gallicola sp. Sow4_E12]|uniref:metallophosphoesterase n=1 Tax=Gallicola sp. Sow4_E12 TaxID=3438785 RepID=UPI003F8E3B4E